MEYQDDKSCQAASKDFSESDLCAMSFSKEYIEWMVVMTSDSLGASVSLQCLVIVRRAASKIPVAR